MQKSRLLNSLLSVSGILILVKISGFVKQMVTAYTFGATMETDLISLSYGFIGDWQYLLVQVLLTSVVSIYISIKSKNENDAGKFAWDTLKVSTFVAGVVSVLIIVCSNPLAHLLAPSYGQEETERLSLYLRLFAPMLLFFVWMGVSHALLNANQRFLPGQFEGLYQSVILIVLSFTLAPVLGSDTLTLGYWVYAIVAAFILLIQARKYVTPVHSNPFCNPHIHTLLRMIGPLLIGYGAVYLNQMVDKMLVSGLETGTITAMSYAAVLTNLVSTLISSLCSVLYAHMSELVSKGNEKEVASLAEQSARILTVLFLPVTIITVFQAEDIVSLVYGRGAFGKKEVELTAMALAGYGFTFIPLAWREIYSRIQYSYQNSKGPTRNSIIGIAINIGLSIVLCPVFGVFGVTFASSISILVIGVLNMITARTNVHNISYMWVLRSLPFLCVGSVISILICHACQIWFASNSALVRLCLSTGLVFLFYGIIIIPLLWKVKIFRLKTSTTTRTGEK